jgi:hypothetical protein
MRPHMRHCALALVVSVGMAGALGCGSDSDDTSAQDAESEAISELEDAVKTSAPPKEEETADGTIRTYFRLLNENGYEEAWKLLSPEVRTQFGGYEHWVGGYETTKSTRITSVEQTGGSAQAPQFQVEISAVDAGPCESALVRGFAGQWALRDEGKKWTIEEASFEQTSGSTTSATCGGTAPVYFTDAAYQVSQRPGQIQVDNHDLLTGLTWSSWGAETASGSGTLEHRVCDPDCATGYSVPLSASVSLSDVVDCGGRRQYRSLTITASGEVPPDFPNPLSVPSFGGC